MFIPTGCYRLLNALQDSFPSFRLIAADFDYLPEPKILPETCESDNKVGVHTPAHNSPLVASKDPHTREYLVVICESLNNCILWPRRSND